jgi:hypothetical protein
MGINWPWLLIDGVGVQFIAIQKDWLWHLRQVIADDIKSVISWEIVHHPAANLLCVLLPPLLESLSLNDHTP